MPSSSPNAEAISRPTPAAAIFDLLAHRWPKLVSSIGTENLRVTNNAAERIIRGFHQYYQGINGFESRLNAQVYFAVFEEFYRFIPFSEDAQPQMRGKSPLLN